MAYESSRWISTCMTATHSLSGAHAWEPFVDVYRTRDGWLVKYDLAGVLPEDVKLTIDGPRLTLSGVRRDYCMEEGCCHYRMEISYTRFERTIELPEEIDPANVALESRHGFLLVRLNTR